MDDDKAESEPEFFECSFVLLPPFDADEDDATRRTTWTVGPARVYLRGSWVVDETDGDYSAEE